MTQQRHNTNENINSTAQKYVILAKGISVLISKYVR